MKKLLTLVILAATIVSAWGQSEEQYRLEQWQRERRYQEDREAEQRRMDELERRQRELENQRQRQPQDQPRYYAPPADPFRLNPNYRR